MKRSLDHVEGVPQEETKNQKTASQLNVVKAQVLAAIQERLERRQAELQRSNKPGNPDPEG